MLVDRVKNENCSTVADVLSIATTSKPNDGCGYHENGIDVRQRKNPPRSARFNRNKALIRSGHILDHDLKFLDGPIEEDKIPIEKSKIKTNNPKMTKRKRCQSSIEQPVEKVPLTELKELVSNTVKEVQSSEIITQNTGSNTYKLKRVLNVQQQMLDLINKF